MKAGHVPATARCNEGRTYGLVARIKSELDPAIPEEPERLQDEKST